MAQRSTKERDCPRPSERGSWVIVLTSAAGVEFATLGRLALFSLTKTGMNVAGLMAIVHNRPVRLQLSQGMPSRHYEFSA
jgi:hypothetical protein